MILGRKRHFATLERSHFKVKLLILIKETFSFQLEISPFILHRNFSTLAFKFKFQQIKSKKKKYKLESNFTELGLLGLEFNSLFDDDVMLMVMVMKVMMVMLLMVMIVMAAFGTNTYREAISLVGRNTNYFQSQNKPNFPLFLNVSLKHVNPRGK